jgi:hypothetical protein
MARVVYRRKALEDIDNACDFSERTTCQYTVQTAASSSCWGWVSASDRTRSETGESET